MKEIEQIINGLFGPNGFGSDEWRLSGRQQIYARQIAALPREQQDALFGELFSRDNTSPPLLHFVAGVISPTYAAQHPGFGLPGAGTPQAIKDFLEAARLQDPVVSSAVLPGFSGQPAVPSSFDPARMGDFQFDFEWSWSAAHPPR